MAIPKYLQDKADLNDKTKPGRHRKKAKIRENRLAKQYGGRASYNSGAVFGDNDVKFDGFEIEDKNIERGSYALKAEYLKEIQRKCKPGNTGILLINFEVIDQEYAVLPWEDLKYLLRL
jgi:hypothetical protein